MMPNSIQSPLALVSGLPIDAIAKRILAGVIQWAGLPRSRECAFALEKTTGRRVSRGREEK
jgi:hypothetical protein